jgi:hypothetical protein
MTVGGCVSTSEKWKSFDVEWRLFLENEGLPNFHMTDFEKWRPPFDFMLPDGQRDKAKHNRILNTVLELILRNVEGFYAYGAVSAVFPEREINHERLMHDCVGGAIKDVFLRVAGDYDEPLNLVFGRQPHFPASKIDRYVEIWSYGPNDGRVASVSHCATSSIPALQAADVLAYEMARAQRANRPERYPFQQLIDGAKARGIPFSITWGPIRSRRVNLSGQGDSWG